MQVHTFRIPSEIDQTHLRFLCSDLHLGSPNCDEKRLKADLADAKNAGARILINGDVFDCIGPRDKRSTPSVLHPKLRGEEDLNRAIVLMATEILEPYADAIDIIGIGNHEEAWIKYNHADPVRDLIERLNLSLERQGSSHRIRHGGICGWVCTRFAVKTSVAGKETAPRHTLYYFHGAGGDSPVTKGTIDVNRKGVNFNYDAITFGHKHNYLFMNDVMLEVSTRGYVRERERLALQTGSYYVNYEKGTQKSVLNYSYATSKAHAPKPRGGLYLLMKPVREVIHFGSKDNGVSLWSVKQDVATSVVGLMKPRMEAKLAMAGCREQSVGSTPEAPLAGQHLYA